MRRVWKPRQKNKSGDIVTHLLKSRGVAEDQRQRFLRPRYEDCHDPFLLRDMDQAVERILQAMQSNERITVYADYDADAVTAAAVLLRFLQSAGHHEVDYYIPDRFSEGYGVNDKAVRELADQGTELMITVDCGINAVKPVKAANLLGMDVVVTDHHQLTGDMPPARAVVNPHRPDDNYPFKDLTGVGVAFKLAQALILKFKLQNSNSKITEGWEKWLLDLVAIGTVADCQSLLGENRILVKWGLYVLTKSKWPGLEALIEVSGIEPPLNTYNIGFQLAPRINAAGRVEHASVALDLLLTEDQQEAFEFAEKLNELNSQRQNLTEQILSEAREQIQKQADRKILFAAGRDWPKGILGLVAGRLSEEFYRPVLVMDLAEREATGSARSISGFNITQALSVSEEQMLRYGGHAQAAGFTLKSQHLEVFRNNLLYHAEETLDEELLQPVLWYDVELQPTDISTELVEILEQFEPCGIGNPRPRFLLKNIDLENIRTVGKDNSHLKAYVQELGCIGFGLGFWKEKLEQKSGTMDMIAELQFNEWNGRKEIQLKIIDLRDAK